MQGRTPHRAKAGSDPTFAEQGRHSRSGTVLALARVGSPGAERTRPNGRRWLRPPGSGRPANRPRLCATSLRLPAKHAPTLAAMRGRSAQSPRYGARRIRTILRGGGDDMRIRRTRRSWRQTNLTLPRKRPKRRVASRRPRPLPPMAGDHVRACDFVFDACAMGQQLKCLTVVDEFTHESLAIDVVGSIRAARVIEMLTRLMSVHGAPINLRSDDGPELVGHAILKRVSEARAGTALIDPGSPWQNETNESLNGNSRDGCLSVERFRTRREAKVIIEAWRQHDNAVLPHSSLGHLTPHELKQHHPPIRDHPRRAIPQERSARNAGLGSVPRARWYPAPAKREGGGRRSRAVAGSWRVRFESDDVRRDDRGGASECATTNPTSECW